MTEDTPESPLPWLSLIVPTRGRPNELRRFFTSLNATVSDPNGLELVLVTDLDDDSYQQLPSTSIQVRQVRVLPKQTMGTLNSEGHRAASGKWLFLLNDDVIARTVGWDQRLRNYTSIFTDEICLLHVNDGIFGDKLCTFPLVSRTYCDIAAEICPNEYNRYRIDDHIYNVFNLLNFSGYNRIVFVADVLFDHQNRSNDAKDHSAYTPDQTIHALDTELFEALLPQRKETALNLAEHIETVRVSQRREILAQRMLELHDSAAMRRSEYVSVLSTQTSISSTPPRVTIGIVSANANYKHAKLCIESVRRHTNDYELILLDNNCDPRFNHPREMNRILSICRTDFAVLMDDDVIVEPGWLDGMLKAMAPDVGVVTPLHKTGDGRLSYAGVVMRPDDSGHHGHDFAVPHQPIAIETLCSAIMLIDIRKCGHIRIDESYTKYFLDIDYGFRVWEAGYRVVLSPFTMITHLAGATLPQGSSVSKELYEAQRSRFVERWIHTGRLDRLRHGAQWRSDSHLRQLSNLGLDLDALLRDRAPRDRVAFERKLRPLFELTRTCPVVHHWAVEVLSHTFGSLGPIALTEENFGVALLIGHFMQPVLVETGVSGLNIVLADGEYFAIPENEGVFTLQKLESGGAFSRVYQGPDLQTVKLAIQADLRSTARNGEPKPEPIAAVSSIEEPRLVQEGYKAYNIVAYGKHYYGLPQSHGAFRPSAVGTETYNRFPVGPTVEIVRRQIDLVQRWSLRRLLGAARRRARRAIRARRRPPNRKDQEEDGPQHFGSAITDPETWLKNSPVELVRRAHENHDIYKFEYKFFAVPAELGDFDYARFKADGRLLRCQIGQSLEEATALIASVASNGEAKPRRYLLLGGTTIATEALLTRQLQSTLVLLASRANAECDANLPVIRLPIDADDEIGRYLLSSTAAPQRDLLVRQCTDVIVPWTLPGVWKDNSLERAAGQLAPIIHVLLPKGGTIRVIGEGVHRLIYNKAYLASLFSKIAFPENQRALEVGCSDGMVCRMLVGLGACHVTGIDIMETVGCSFPNEKISYQKGSAHALSFPANSFDLVVSIATFEHLRDPRSAFSEIIRVLRPGGHAYVQAGPLYHSPFGHHMFGYFDSAPWIHLRMQPDRIAEYARRIGMAERIELEQGRPVEQYIQDMLHTDHVNGLMLKSYALDDLKTRRDIAVVMTNVSYEGTALLDDKIRGELTQFDDPTLTEHGFEVLLRKLPAKDALN